MTWCRLASEARRPQREALANHGSSLVCSGEPLKRSLRLGSLYMYSLLAMCLSVTIVFCGSRSSAAAPQSVAAISIRAHSSQTDGSYETAIASLSENSDAAQVASAIAVLENSGTKAFPALLAHLNDTARASVAFQRAVMAVDAKGNALSHPTIGEACFDLIQKQVEGNWPKGFRQYYVLSPENVVSWWQARKSKPLKELQIETAQASLLKARQRRGKPGYWPEAVRFLEGRLRELKDHRFGFSRNGWTSTHVDLLSKKRCASARHAAAIARQ